MGLHCEPVSGRWRQNSALRPDLAGPKPPGAFVTTAACHVASGLDRVDAAGQERVTDWARAIRRNQQFKMKDELIGDQ
jgi:hypothetical protein